jgi:hypothetical protein
VGTLLLAALGYAVLNAILTPSKSRTFPLPDPWSAPGPVATEIPARLTPATEEAMVNAYRAAFNNSPLRRDPTKNELAMFLAQSALETGRWKSMYNFNPAFLTTSTRGYFKLHVPGQEKYKYSAFTQAYEGTGAHVSWVMRNSPNAFLAATAGDPLAFARALKAAKFFEVTADEYYGKTPDKGLRALFPEFLRGLAA